MVNLSVGETCLTTAFCPANIFFLLSRGFT